MSRLSTSAAFFALLSVALPAVAQLPLAGQTVQFVSVLTDPNDPYCLSALDNADGAHVTVESCNGTATAANSWLVPNGASVEGTLQIYGDKCLDVTNGVNADGTLLQIWTCASGNTNQMWTPGNEDPIQWGSTGKCIDLTNGVTSPSGGQFQVWDCDQVNENQLFNIEAVTKPKTRKIQPKANQGLCVTAASNTVGAKVVVEKCSDSLDSTQAWTNPSGAMYAIAGANSTAPPLCITPLDNNFLADGTPLVLAECDLTGATADQNWNFGGQGSVINNGGYGKNVMDLTNGNATAGQQLQIWFGNVFAGLPDDTNQDWFETFAY
ncbi:hypothetical protein HMN09_01104100 [Mycena chlorophos]|uniref:Ricin B lectin domain-containing protein n=1 Tax=Mycena chlorophos TaxID=658473 RepID=A0A8H6SCR8_MYCCL|nr:hypothetical protein HMN09_01104100 [Mycena chlorophos]